MTDLTGLVVEIPLVHIDSWDWDDFNGYVDDVHGWDFAENNNDPNPAIDNQTHGTHVAGCASAVTNNGVGEGIRELKN